MGRVGCMRTLHSNKLLFLRQHILPFLMILVGIVHHTQLGILMMWECVGSSLLQSMSKPVFNIF
uniref:Putative ovule protein n=1 Tax=Solanum chacoense TaxID=4108 RepID=A0A0V0GZZ9_SOLCH